MTGTRFAHHSDIKNDGVVIVCREGVDPGPQRTALSCMIHIIATRLLGRFCDRVPQVFNSDGTPLLAFPIRKSIQSAGVPVPCGGIAARHVDDVPMPEIFLIDLRFAVIKGLCGRFTDVMECRHHGFAMMRHIEQLARMIGTMGWLLIGSAGVLALTDVAILECLIGGC